MRQALRSVDVEAMLRSAARLRCSLDQDSLQASAQRLQGRLWEMSPHRLLDAAASLQSLGYRPAPGFLMDWMEECHCKLPGFNPLELVRLIETLAAWSVSPGAPWVNDLLAAAAPQLFVFSRSRLVEFMTALAALDVRLLVSGLPAPNPGAGGPPAPRHHLPAPLAPAHAATLAAAVATAVQRAAPGPGDGAARGAAVGRAAAAAAAPATAEVDGAEFMHRFLLSFLSRSAQTPGSRRPLPRHVADLAVSLAQLCCGPEPPPPPPPGSGQQEWAASSPPPAPAPGCSWRPETAALLRQALDVEELPTTLRRLAPARIAAAAAAVARLGL